MGYYCNNCDYSDWDGEKESYWCSYHKVYVKEYDSCERHPERFYQEREEVVDEPEDDSVCYITTAACNVLNLADDNEILTTLRNFRNNVMKKDPKYHKLLVLYDVVGPKISSELSKDHDRKMVSNIAMIMIKKAYDYIREEKYDEAVNKYYEMTTALAEYYAIEVPEITDEFVNQVDIEQSGTGKLMIKKGLN